MITYERLKVIIPADQALANKALQASFEQVKGISEIQGLPQFANAVAALETNQGLTLINSQTQAVPTSVQNYIANTVATGTGPNGTITIGDVMGSASGYNITNQLANVISNAANIDTTTLNTTYNRMVLVLDGTYTGFGNTIIIPTGPGQGTYGNADAAILSLCASANTTISGLVSTYPNQTANINSNWTILSNAVSNQVTNFAAADIDYDNLVANSFPAIKSFVDNLHDWGVQTEAGGPAEYLQAVATVTNQTGQAIVGAMREGRNIAALNNGGVGLNSEIPATPATPPTPGQISDPNYTPAQAQANVITS